MKMSHLKNIRLKYLAFFLRILLVSLICILSLLDAVEYVQCTHLGRCEFLEIQRNIISHYEPGQDHTSSGPFYFLSRYINPYNSKKNWELPFLKKKGKVLILQKNAFLSIRKSIPSQFLKIIATSIIIS